MRVTVRVCTCSFRAQTHITIRLMTFEFWVSPLIGTVCSASLARGKKASSRAEYSSVTVYPLLKSFPPRSAWISARSDGFFPHVWWRVKRAGECRSVTSVSQNAVQSVSEISYNLQLWLHLSNHTLTPVICIWNSKSVLDVCPFQVVMCNVLCGCSLRLVSSVSKRSLCIDIFRIIYFVYCSNPNIWELPCVAVMFPSWPSICLLCLPLCLASASF